MPSLTDRVEVLEATVAKLCTCMREVHHTLDAQERLMREQGEYSSADLCEHCHDVIEDQFE